MFRRLALVILTSLLVLLGGPTAKAAPPNTSTDTYRLVDTFVGTLPGCEQGTPYIITTTSNVVEHETTFDDGRVHATFTSTGTLTAVPLDDPTLPSFTGNFTVRGSFIDNGSTMTGQFTFSARATGSDGSTISQQDVDHFNVRPDGTVNDFYRCH